MPIWNTIKNRIKQFTKGAKASNMLGRKEIEEKLNIAVAISPQMEKAMNLWAQMYENHAPWLHEPDSEDVVRITSLGLPSLIASEKARTALIEFKSEITTPTEEVEEPNPDYKNPPDMKMNMWGQPVPDVKPETITTEVPTSDTSRAEYLNEQYTKLKDRLRTELEYGIALGGFVIKPYIVEHKQTAPQNAEEQSTAQLENTDESTTAQGAISETPVEEKPNYDIEFDFIRADSFFPIAFDASGHITEAIFIQSKTSKDTIYRRLEYHKWENNTSTILNYAFKNNNQIKLENTGKTIELGKEIPLTEVPEWSSLTPEITIKNVEKPLFAYFKMPEANIIDRTSPLGVSGYARAVSLIKDADKQYSSLLWEYEAGEMALDVDRDAFRWRQDGGDEDEGYSSLGAKQQRLYRRVDVAAHDGETFQAFAPALRDVSYTNGLNSILMRIEDACAMSRGTLANVAAEARTATELKIMKQRSYQANAEVQKALETALKDVIYAMDALCSLYEITPEGEYDTSFEWDDSILVDVDAELGKRLTLMQNGLAGKVETRMWFFGETERQAQDALNAIADENKSVMEDEMGAQAFNQGEEGING